MKFRFTYEAIIGMVSFLVVLFLGNVGGSILALIAFLPLITKIKNIRLDEREMQLFYKVGNLTFGLTILALVGINYFGNYKINGNPVGNSWLMLSLSGIMLMHGIAGLIVFKTQ
jgi:energy-converting hydrogenase Eha subunit A